MSRGETSSRRELKNASTLVRQERKKCLSQISVVRLLLVPGWSEDERDGQGISKTSYTRQEPVIRWPSSSLPLCFAMKVLGSRDTVFELEGKQWLAAH